MNKLTLLVDNTKTNKADLTYIMVWWRPEENVTIKSVGFATVARCHWRRRSLYWTLTPVYVNVCQHWKIKKSIKVQVLGVRWFQNMFECHIADISSMYQIECLKANNLYEKENVVKHYTFSDTKVSKINAISAFKFIYTFQTNYMCEKT